MPNRIIKESICSSDSIDDLSWFEEVFFYRLIVNVDDYGRLDARPRLLNSKLFPLKDNIRDDTILNSLRKLSLLGIANVYAYNNRPYLELSTWSDHQTIRNKKSKFPSIDDSIVIDFNLLNEKTTCKQFDDYCKQLNADASKCPRNPIQSESNPNQNPNPDTDASARKDELRDSKTIPPTLEEVQGYCQKRQNKVDAQTFIDFYTGKGWMIGKNKMKDWQACVRTWEKDSKGRNNTANKNKFHNFEQRDVDYDALVGQIGM